MSNTFTRKVSRNIGTSLTSVGSYTVGAGVQTTVIGGGPVPDPHRRRREGGLDHWRQY